MVRKTASDFFDDKCQEDKLDELSINSEKDVKEAAVESDKEKYSESKSDCESESKGLVSSSASAAEKAKVEPKNESKDDKEPLNPLTEPSADQQQQQYMQYMMQYQQYYAQYYSQYYSQTQSTTPTTSDPVYELYSNNLTAPVNPAVSFDATRANKQMTAYFDPNKFQSVLSPEMQAAQKAAKEQQQARLTAKEIEAFKKKKIEKKKAKNRWFYE